LTTLDACIIWLGLPRRKHIADLCKGLAGLHRRYALGKNCFPLSPYCAAFSGNWTECSQGNLSSQSGENRLLPSCCQKGQFCTRWATYVKKVRAILKEYVDNSRLKIEE
jgi:hypothetical protein